MAPSAGLEPTAIRLTVERSTIELRGNKKPFVRFELTTFILQGCCSTIELKGQVGGRTGLEPALLRSQRRILPIYDRPHGGTMGI